MGIAKLIFLYIINLRHNLMILMTVSCNHISLIAKIDHGVIRAKRCIFTQFFTTALEKKIFSAFHRTQLSTDIYANRPMLALEVRASNKLECDYSKS